MVAASRLPAGRAPGQLLGCLLLFLTIPTVLLPAETPVNIVVGPDAPVLERSAAAELAEGLRRLHGITAEIGTQIKAGAETILVGSPTSNPSTAAVIAQNWPRDLSDQGHVVRSVRSGDRTMLVIGGNRPVATFWGVAEYLHRAGQRSLLQSDFVAVERTPFTVTGFDVVVEPRSSWRGWKIGDGGVSGWEAWSVADYRRLFRQLAKQKFTHVVFQPPEKSSAIAAWKVSGDTAGRKAFQGQAVFENADLKGVSGDDARWAACVKSAAELAGEARSWGLELVTADSPEAARWPTVRLFEEAVGPLPQVKLQSLPADFLAADADTRGWTLHARTASDAELPTYFFARRATDQRGTPRGAAEELITTIAGPGVAERLLKGFDEVEKAGELMRANDPQFAAPGPKMVSRHGESSEPAPAWWAQVRDLYTEAMNEMYRGNTRARDGGREFILYFARRYEFGLTYLTSLEAFRAAAIARAKSDADTESQQLEAAVENMYNALGAFSEVARDPSDRGTIALLNQWAFRALQE